MIRKLVAEDGDTRDGAACRKVLLQLIDGDGVVNLNTISNKKGSKLSICMAAKHSTTHITNVDRAAVGLLLVH